MAKVKFIDSLPKGKETEDLHKNLVEFCESLMLLPQVDAIDQAKLARLRAYIDINFKPKE